MDGDSLQDLRPSQQCTLRQTGQSLPEPCNRQPHVSATTPRTSLNLSRYSTTADNSAFAGSLSLVNSQTDFFNQELSCSLSCCGSWHVLRYHVVNCACDLCALGLFGCGACELPTASFHLGGTGVLWVLTRTHTCGPPPKQNMMEVTRAPTLVVDFVEWIVDGVERVWNWEDKVRIPTLLHGEWAAPASHPESLTFSTSPAAFSRFHR